MRVLSTGTGPVRRAPFPHGPIAEVLVDEHAGAGQPAAAYVTVPPGGGMPDHAHGEPTALVVPLTGELLISGSGAAHQGKVTVGVVVLLDQGGAAPASIDRLRQDHVRDRWRSPDARPTEGSPSQWARRPWPGAASPHPRPDAAPNVAREHRLRRGCPAPGREPEAFHHTATGQRKDAATVSRTPSNPAGTPDTANRISAGPRPAGSAGRGAGSTAGRGRDRSVGAR